MGARQLGCATVASARSVRGFGEASRGRICGRRRRAVIGTRSGSGGGVRPARPGADPAGRRAAATRATPQRTGPGGPAAATSATRGTRQADQRPVPSPRRPRRALVARPVERCAARAAELVPPGTSAALPVIRRQGALRTRARARPEVGSPASKGRPSPRVPGRGLLGRRALRSGAGRTTASGPAASPSATTPRRALVARPVERCAARAAELVPPGTSAALPVIRRQGALRTRARARPEVGSPASKGRPSPRVPGRGLLGRQRAPPGR